MTKVLEMPTAVQIFTQLGGIQIICKNLVNLNKTLVNTQPSLVSSSILLLPMCVLWFSSLSPYLLFLKNSYVFGLPLSLFLTAFSPNPICLLTDLLFLPILLFHVLFFDLFLTLPLSALSKPFLQL